MRERPQNTDRRDSEAVGDFQGTEEPGNGTLTQGSGQGHPWWHAKPALM